MRAQLHVIVTHMVVALFANFVCDLALATHAFVIRLSVHPNNAMIVILCSPMKIAFWPIKNRLTHHLRMGT